MNAREPFLLGEWTVDPATGLLIGAAGQRRLTPKLMDLLVALVQRAGRVVTRDELLREVWGARGAVSDEPLTRGVAELRKALGDDRAEPAYIETIPKRGYRVIAKVGAVEPAGPRPTTSADVVRPTSAPAAVPSPLGATHGGAASGTMVALPPGAAPPATPLTFKPGWWRVGVIAGRRDRGRRGRAHVRARPVARERPRAASRRRRAAVRGLEPDRRSAIFRGRGPRGDHHAAHRSPDASRHAARDRELVSRSGQAGQRGRARARRRGGDARDGPLRRRPRARHRAADRRRDRQERLGRNLRSSAHAREPIRHPSRDRRGRRGGSHALARCARRGSRSTTCRPRACRRTRRSYWESITIGAASRAT